MASRFPQRSNNSLFSAYDAQTRPTSNSPFRPSSNPPAPQSQSGRYSGHHHKKSDDNPPRSGSANAFAAYPGAAGNHASPAPSNGGFRAASPNAKGQYSDAVLSELESQNDEGIAGLTGKVRMLKDLTTAIGTEIRDSTSLAESMNRSFETTSVKLKGTMNRMLRMAEKTGVGWKVWVLFFVAVWGLFAYIWLF